MRIDSPISCNAQITGSFTGSFIGDGSGITGVTAEWDGSHNGDATITGSLTVSSNIIVDGTVDGVDVAGLNTSYLITSASAASNAAAIAALDDTYATDADITSLSSSAHTQRLAIESGLDSDISSLSGSSHTQRVALDSAQSTALTNVSGAFASTVSSLSTADSLLDGRVTTLEGTDISITLTGDVSGTGTITNLVNVSFATTVADDSHNHIIGNVDGLQDALDLKAPLASPALTGTPTAPTQTGTDDSTKIATTAFVQGRIDAIIGTAGSTLDTLGELSASLAADQSGLAALTTTVGGKLQKDQNLSDLQDAATARTNLGVDTKANTWTGISGDVSISSLGVATVADDSHNHIIGNVDGLQAALDAKQAAGTYNTIIGTDTDLDTTGAEVVDQINVTDGVITSMSKRTLTLANLGYTGATDANNYSHPTFAGDDINVDTGALTGATVISDLDFNITTDTNGHVTDANGTVSTRTLTLADLGYTGASNANYITNNNQLTNGAGYITSYVDTTYSAGTGVTLTGTTFSIGQAVGTGNNVHFEGLMVGQSSGATANTIRCVGDVVAYYSSDAQFKDNVETLEGALDKVKAIRGVRFDWNDKQDVFEGHDIGVIAQEVEAVLPELVHYREHNDSKAVDYVKLTAVLIEAVKELAAKVEELSK